MAGNNAGGGTANGTTPSRYSFWVVVIGLLAVVAAFVFSVYRFTTAADVAAALGPLFGVIGTIVGAFFGLNIGAQGKEKAEEGKQKAEAERDASRAQVAALAAELPKERRDEVLTSFR